MYRRIDYMFTDWGIMNIEVEFWCVREEQFPDRQGGGRGGTLGGIIKVKQSRRKEKNNDKSSEGRASCWGVHVLWFVYGLGGGKVV